jgi:hypothetical protein
MSFEGDLRSALRREPAPEGFAARVLAKTAAAERATVVPFRGMPLTLAMAAGLIVALMIPPGLHEYKQRQRGIEAKDQLMVALSITRVQLKQARGKIRQGTRAKL